MALNISYPITLTGTHFLVNEYQDAENSNRLTLSRPRMKMLANLWTSKKYNSYFFDFFSANGEVTNDQVRNVYSIFNSLHCMW